MITIKIKDSSELTSDFPLTAREVLARLDYPDKKLVVACRVNAVQRPLSWKIDMDSVVDFIKTDTLEGMEVYIRTLSFMLTTAARRACQIRLTLRQSINNAYYYDSPSGPISGKQCKEILEEMRRMVEDGTPLVREEVSIDKACVIMLSQGYNNKDSLLRWVGNDPVVLYRCEGVYDFFGGALADTASMVPVFNLCTYSAGLFLICPSFKDPTKVRELHNSPKTLSLFQDYTKWLDHLDLSTMDRIHEHVANGRSRDLIMVSEALHTRILSNITEQIESRHGVRLLCLAGPSSSGKTTSSRRLRVQLLSSGIDSVTLELDNYFVDRENTPKDSEGHYDFEALEALDYKLINEHLAALINGEEVEIPKFDFVEGKRTKGTKMRLRPDQLLVVEGIHGLNDELSKSIAPENKYRIFVCPMTGTNIDRHNRIGTTDTRLMRRILRDRRTRGISPEQTLIRWPSVVRGSFNHIFPYQQNADAIFNTALAYELPVLKGYILQLLRSIQIDSPAFGEARRLMSILEYVPVIPSDDVPNLSILREFIGGSCFE